MWSHRLCDVWLCVGYMYEKLSLFCPVLEVENCEFEARGWKYVSSITHKSQQSDSSVRILLLRNRISSQQHTIASLQCQFDLLAAAGDLDHGQNLHRVKNANLQ